MVVVELEKLAKKFDRFGWERDRGSLAHDGMIEDWIEALCDFPLDEIQAACRAAVLENPNRMPNEGHIRAQILAARKRRVSLRPVVAAEPVLRPEISPEDRAHRLAVVASLGLKRFGGEA